MPSELLVSPARAAKLRIESRGWPSIDLSARQICDLELLLNGAFAPLRGFMTRAECESVARHSRLPDDAIWPAPVTLDLDPAVQHAFSIGGRVALRDREGVMLAALRVDDAWADAAGPHIGGEVEGVQFPVHHDFERLRKTPAQAAAQFAPEGANKIAAYQAVSATPATVLGAVFESARTMDAALLVQLIPGSARPDDVEYFERVRAYENAVASQAGAALTILPLCLDATGARALVLRAIVAKNFGCTHLLVHGDIPQEARKQAWEVGIELAAVAEAAATPRPRAPEPRARPGFTVFFTGLSGSGKSTIANALLVKLLEVGRTVSLLDGDVVRKHLSSELGFSKEHRDLNIRRIGYVASEITRHGGIAICAPIAPYDNVRQDVRQMIEAHGRFVLVHVSTPLEVCEQRDRKGLYAKARAGLVQQFTGISDPYEVPGDAALTIDTTQMQVDEAANVVLNYLRQRGYLDGPSG